MTFDDENKPKSQDIPNTQVPQASGDEVEPQSGAVGANAGGLEEMNAKEAAVQLGHNARQADSEATQMFNPNDYAQWNSFQESTRQMPSAAQLQEHQTDSSQTYISTVPPVEEAQPKKRKKLSKIVVFAVIAAAVFMLLASVRTASDISVPLIALLAFIPALLSVLGVIFTRKNGKVGGRIGAYVAIGVTVVAVVVMGGRMIAYTVHTKAEHKAAIETSCQSITWPDGDFAKKLPALANQKGEVYSDSSDYVSIKLCNATQSSFDSYVKDAKKMGYDKSAHSFTAKDAGDNEITVFFMEDEEDGNTMDITLDAPKSKDDSKAQDSTDGQQTQESQSQQQSQNTQQQEQQSQQNQQSDPSQVSADFKASMDSYEQFFDQYAEFMKKYKDSGDSISMLADYTKMMQQYTDTMNKLNAIDQNSLSAADEAYYLEVMGRITQKLASVA
nr:DUF6591 domain-containing protein [Bifidobacterium catenulatum]